MEQMITEASQSVSSMDAVLQLAQKVTPTPSEPVTSGGDLAGAATQAVTGLVTGADVDLDFSIVGMFLRADFVVQAVIVVLAFASFWSWTIIFEKILHIRRVNHQSSKFEDSFWSGGSLDDLYDKIGDRPRDPMGAMFNAAMREWRRASPKERHGEQGARVSLQQRIDRIMLVTFGREMDRIERYLSFLASVGSVAPFVGLFGTVWGITHSFQSIALTKNTSLTAVAPGIAEALFATALGLVAAIPAVIAFNKFSSDLSRYANRLTNFADEFSAILSRQLEEDRS